jgi:hypothetical protein
LWSNSVVPVGHKGKKIKNSTSDIIISQSVHSISANFFAHVLLVAYGKMLWSKVQKNIKKLFGLLELEMALLGCFLRRKASGL